jgi:hypothetical protein
MPVPTGMPSRWLVTSWVLRAIVAAGLAVDAFVHADLADLYDLNEGTTFISQGDLFRIEAVFSTLVAAAIILTRWRLTWLLAVAVAGSALGGLLLYRYVDPGMLGPLPDMYEPSMYPEKVLAAVAESVATAAAALGYGVGVHLARAQIRRERTATAPPPGSAAPKREPIRRPALRLIEDAADEELSADQGEAPGLGEPRARWSGPSAELPARWPSPPPSA